MNTPIAIIFFNRIEPLRVLVARLTEVKPKKIYLISDAARENKIGEAEAVASCRELMTHLPWECEVRENFAEHNMGCRRRVVSGLDWLFAQEERAIILEDDCVPLLDFFPFMEDSLMRYATEDKVIAVGATNFGVDYSPKSEDIFFTKYPVSTGWGTWRRAWHLMDGELKLLPKAKKSHRLRKWLGGWWPERYWFYVLKRKPNSWAYRWSFTAFMYGKLTAICSANLIDNIGFNDPLATNTTVGADVLGFPKADKTWKYQGRFPNEIVTNEDFDRYIESTRFSKSISERIRWLFRKVKLKLLVLLGRIGSNCLKGFCMFLLK